ncbi:unnamed protein product [Angiostrongylus costaricensis]|uniref:Pentatricopeptide repeat-containing protein n=1 Tax=Angiostrongylus costaricensis TaxID=334426 RepID=A0A0R3PGP5_ANGCS|nr:unnamed protein product [Angiostrongylus costaricensis]
MGTVVRTTGVPIFLIGSHVKKTSLKKAILQKRQLSLYCNVCLSMEVNVCRTTTSPLLNKKTKRLHPLETGRIVVANAVLEMTRSVHTWMKTAEIEVVKAKKKVFRRALEQFPTSVRVWKVIMELEESDEGRVLLTRRVEC